MQFPGALDKTLKVWDLESGRELNTLTGHEGIVVAVAVTTDGQYAISGSLDKTLKVWDLEHSSILVEFYGDSVLGVYSFTNPFSSIIAGDDSGRIYILHLTGRKIGQIK